MVSFFFFIIISVIVISSSVLDMIKLFFLFLFSGSVQEGHIATWPTRKFCSTDSSTSYKTSGNPLDPSCSGLSFNSIMWYPIKKILIS